MDKYAIVKDGIVANVIEYEAQPTTPIPGFEEGHVAIQADRVSPGWVYSNGQFTDPNPPRPIMEFSYKEKRAAAYPPMADYLDGIVKNDQAQIDKYVADCLAVKAKYPKT